MLKRIVPCILALIMATGFFLVPTGCNANNAEPKDSSSAILDESSEIDSLEETEETTTEETTIVTSEETNSKSDDSHNEAAPLEPAINNNAPEGSPVSTHGQLSVKGSNIVDEAGEVFQIRGMSTHGVTWFPDFVNENSFKTLRDDWKTNCIRLAMYVDEEGNAQCYLQNPDGSKQILEKGIDICLDLGMYVIIDWHVLNPGDPSAYTQQAKEFFAEISEKYDDYPNIIYEICNEPNGTEVKWADTIKPYCEEVISIIRENDEDAIIIAGTGTWSQDIHQVQSGGLLSDGNVVYALHYYANEHKDKFRERLEKCYNNGLPVLVSEFGNCEADGDGANDIAEATAWLEMLDQYNIGYLNWSLSDKAESASALVEGANANGNWSDSDLTESGKFMRDWFIKRDREENN